MRTKLVLYCKLNDLYQYFVPQDQFGGSKDQFCVTTRFVMEYQLKKGFKFSVRLATKAERKLIQTWYNNLIRNNELAQNR